jgi:hypothetical protein
MKNRILEMNSYREGWREGYEDALEIVNNHINRIETTCGTDSAKALESLIECVWGLRGVFRKEVAK